MAKTKTLGSAIVRFLSQGLEKLKAEIGIVQNSVGKLSTEQERAQRRAARAAKEAAKDAAGTRKWWDDLGGSMTAVGRHAAASLGIAAGAAIGFARLADPRGADLLTIAIGRLGIQIGRIFVPALRALVDWVNRAADLLKSMSDATRETILQWSLFAAKVLAVGAAFGIVGGYVAPAIGHILTLTDTLRRFAGIGLGPLLGGLGLIAAALAAISFGEEGSGFFAGIQRAIDAVRPSIEALWDAISAALPPLMESFGALAQAFLNLLPAVMPFIVALVDLATSVIPMVTAVLTILIDAVTWLIDTFGTFGITTVITYIAITRIMSGLGGLIGVVRSVIGAVQSMVSAFTAMLSNPWTIAFLAIAVAIGAIVASISSAGSAVEDVSRGLDRMEEISRRLRSGGRLTRRDISDALTAGGEGSTASAILSATPAERRRIAAERLTVLEARRRTEFGGATVEGLSAEEETVRAALAPLRTMAGLAASAESRGLGATEIFSAGSRESLRLEALRTAGVSESTIDRMRATGTLGGGELSEDAVRSLTTATSAAAPLRRLEGSIDALRAVAEGRTELGGDSGDRFRGEMRREPQRFVGLLDIARNIQTAGGEDPRTALERETRDATRAVARDAARTATATETMAAGVSRPIVPGS